MDPSRGMVASSSYDDITETSEKPHESRNTNTNSPSSSTPTLLGVPGGSPTHKDDGGSSPRLRKISRYAFIGKMSRLYNKSRCKKNLDLSPSSSKELLAEKEFIRMRNQAHRQSKTSNQPSETDSFFCKVQVTRLCLCLGQILGLLLFVWLIGYMSLSSAWVIMIAIVATGREMAWREKLEKRKLLHAISENEQKVIAASSSDLPTWVHFPDVERAEWINRALFQLWPFIGNMVKSILKNNVEKQMRQFVPSALSGLKFETISLGDVPPRIGGVRTYTNRVSRKEIILDLDLIYAGDCKLSVSAKRLVFGIEDLQLRGTMRVILGPLLDESPLIGGVTVFFLTRPSLEFNLTNLLNALEVPGVYGILSSLISDVIANSMVHPNRLTIPLVENVKHGHLKHPIPEGLLRVHIIKATNLVAKDFSIGNSTSDPYVKLTVGDKVLTSSVKDSTLNPEWNEWFDFFIEDFETCVLNLTVFDKDVVKDEFLGSKEINVSSFLSRGSDEAYVPLENIKHGKLKLHLQWMQFSDNPEDLIRFEAISAKTKNLPASAVCFVYVDSARNLPMAVASSSSCNPVCKVKIGNEVFESTRMINTRNPNWEHLFKFKLYDFLHRDVEFSIHDHKKGDKLLASTRVNLGQLVQLPSMCIEKPFDLEGSSEQDTTMSASISLRGLVVDDLQDDNNDRDSSITSTGTLDDSFDFRMDTSDDKGIEQGLSSMSSNLRLRKAMSESQLDEDDDRESSPSPDDMMRGRDLWRKSRRTFSFLSRRKQSSNTAFVPDNLAQQGEISLSVVYTSSNQKLKVTVHNCKDLFTMVNGEDEQLVKPYVRIYLLPDKNGESRFATENATNPMNPVFNESVEYSVSGKDKLKKMGLDVMVKSDLPFYKRPFGKSFGFSRTVIHLADVDVDSSEPSWYELYKM